MGDVPSLAAQLGDAIRTLKERDAEIADLRDNLQIKQGALSESRRQRSERDAEIAALRQQVAELQATVKKLQAEIHAADIRGVLDWTS